MKKILTILFILCLLPLPASAKKRQSETVIVPMKQLQKREFQTRTYNSIDKESVMKSMLNVYQDEGFIVYNVNSLLGFIYGAKDFDISDSDTDISKEFGLTKSRLNFNGVNVATVESTANFTQYGQDLKVRVTFRRKLLNTYGTAQFIDDINDAEYYQEFFDKLDSALSLQKQEKTVKLEPVENQKQEMVDEKEISQSQLKSDESEKPVKKEKKKKSSKIEAPTPAIESEINSENVSEKTEAKEEVEKAKKNNDVQKQEEIIKE